MQNQFVCQSCGSILSDKGGCPECASATVVPLWDIVFARAMAQYSAKLAAWTAAQAQGVPAYA